MTTSGTGRCRHPSRSRSSATGLDAVTRAPRYGLADRTDWLTRSGIGGTAIVGTLIFLIALSLRGFAIGRSWELHVDEITYLRITEGFANNGSLTLYGQPFFLHPPGWFVLTAPFVALLPDSATLFDEVYLIRLLTAVVGALSVALIWHITRWSVGAWAGVVAALLAALDPFVVRTQSRGLLETPALCWVLIGYALLLPILSRGEAVGRRRASFAGLAFGAALLTKDMTAFLTLLPLGACLIFGAPLSRRVSIRIALTAALAYLPYPLLVVLSGEAQAFADQKLNGLLRLLGIVHETGFNQQGGPSFTAAIVRNLPSMAPTYILILLGSVAAALLLGSRRSDLRLLGLWTASGYALLVYCVVRGTLEEQFFYFLLIPAIPAVVVSLTLIAGGADHWTWTFLRPALVRRVVVLRRIDLRADEARGFVRVLVVVGLVGFIVWSGTQWLRTHSKADNGYERLLAEMAEVVPPGARVGVTTETAEFIMSGYDSGTWITPEELQAAGAQYVVVSLYEVEAGYGFADENLYRWIAGHGVLMGEFSGPTNTAIQLWRLPASGHS